MVTTHMGPSRCGEFVYNSTSFLFFSLGFWGPLVFCIPLTRKKPGNVFRAVTIYRLFGVFWEVSYQLGTRNILVYVWGVVGLFSFTFSDTPMSCDGPERKAPCARPEICIFSSLHSNMYQVVNVMRVSALYQMIHVIQVSASSHMVHVAQVGASCHMLHVNQVCASSHMVDVAQVGTSCYVLHDSSGEHHATRSCDLRHKRWPTSQ